LNIDLVSKHEHALRVAHDAFARVETSECLEADAQHYTNSPHTSSHANRANAAKGHSHPASVPVLRAAFLCVVATNLLEYTTSPPLILNP
jgi:hypothetical protein